MTEQNDINSLKTEFQTLLQALEVRELAINDKIAEALKELEKQLTTTLTQGLPKIFATSFEEIISKIITELNITNEKSLKLITGKINDNYTTDLQRDSKAIEEAEVKIKGLLKDLNTIDKNKVQRFCLSIFTSIVISALTATTLVFYIVKNFPTRVIISNPQNIILQDSDVSLWGTDNVKVLRKGKK